MASPYAGQIARNTTGYPTSSAGGARRRTGAVTSALGGANPYLTDPGYLSALAAEQTGSQQADNALRAAQEQAIVGFGDPSLASAAGLNVSPLTAAMAAQNTASGTSTVAGLQRTRDDNQQTILDNLAAHGMLDSGQTGYATGRNQQAYGRDLAGAQTAALSGLNAAAATDVSAKQGLHSDVTNALLGAYQTYVSNPQFWGAAGVGSAPATPRAPSSPPLTKALVTPAPVRPVGTAFQTARNVRMG